MKPDWQKDKKEAEEKDAKARQVGRPNFMSQKKEPESDSPATEAADVTSGARAGKPDWQEQTATAKPEAEHLAIEPEAVPEPEPFAARSAVPETYTVQSGDSLSMIAQRIYGDGNFWVDIWKLNQGQISDPNVIRPGQELNLPPVP